MQILVSKTRARSRNGPSRTLPVLNSLILLGGFLCVLRIATSAAGAPPQLPSTGVSPGHQRMLALLRKIADETSNTNPYIGDGPARRAREELAALPATTPAGTRWLLLMRVAGEELRLGNEAEAITYFKQAHQLLSRTRDPVDPTWLPASLFRLGVAYMRFAETENCRTNPTANSCILPLRDDAIHQQVDGSRQAIAAFTEVLASTPTTSPMHLATRWLLNLAHMTIGDYPAKVPKYYLIPPKAFESDEEIPRFTNIAPRLGLDTFNMAGGAIADDFDDDGYLDLVVSTWDAKGQIRFFKNDHDGSFSERTEQAGLSGLFGGLNIVQGDYNNDGHVDILVLRGAWLEKNGQHPNSLLRNNGNGTFTDVTFDAGLGGVHLPTHSASWGDYDNDGDLDLYVGNESSAAIAAPSQLFRNNGDGTFTDVAVQAGVRNDRYAKGVIWGDYDSDRRLDLYVSNYKGANRLYHNNGDGTFTDVAEELGVSRPLVSFPTWFWDFDNDGALDLYVSAYAAEVSDLAAKALNLPINVELAKLYRGTGTGRFKEVAGQYNLGRPNAPMGANFGDLDNDGYLDFYLGTGYPHYQNLMPNVMFRNRGGKGFADVSYSGGFAHLQKGHAVVFADFDHDGDQDVFEQMGGAYPGDRANNVLYENPGFGNHWITVRLVGVRSNRSAIGARIRAQIVENGKRRSIYKYVNSGGTFGANPLRQTIGLGSTSTIEVLEVFWPTSGLTQTFNDVPVDRTIRIVEGESSYASVELKTVKLGRDSVTDREHVHR
jgi:hypothetical protein